MLLHHGAARVYAVDVGHGQLAWALRTDPRVVVHERVNARYLSAEQVPEPIEALVCDASFIGLATLLPAPLALCAPGAWAVALIKPQFEAGPGQVGKGGVVRDPAVHRAVCARMRDWWAALPGWRVLGSPKARSRAGGQPRVPDRGAAVGVTSNDIMAAYRAASRETTCHDDISGRRRAVLGAAAADDAAPAAPSRRRPSRSRRWRSPSSTSPAIWR